MAEHGACSTRDESILGYRVFAAPVGDCVEEVVRWIARGDRARWLACLNPHSYAVARATPTFAEALRAADWLVPDGVGVVAASRVLGGGIRDRITGCDVFEGVNRALNGRRGRVFFLGSTPEALAKIRARLALDFPRLRVAGTYSPPFKAEFDGADLDDIVRRVNAADAEVLWVGLTAPKQECLLHRLGPRLTVRFAAGIGAVFDFYAGRVRRSPVVFQRLGLEWLPRLLQEPRRLWPRTFVSGPIFVGDVARERMRTR
jgi:N-acetylglucosaminyldiphosphoundecaprenol N-acetyl-beta-D-mannosaminyltransferase